jgi:hypothetical protein
MLSDGRTAPPSPGNHRRRTTCRDDWTAERPAVLIALSARHPDVCHPNRRAQRALRIERVMADELESVSAKPVGSLTSHRIDRCARWNPFWAVRPLVATRNSCSASGNGNGKFRVLLRVVVLRAVEAVAHAGGKSSRHEILMPVGIPRALTVPSAPLGADAQYGVRQRCGQLSGSSRMRSFFNDVAECRRCGHRRSAPPLRP